MQIVLFIYRYDRPIPLLTLGTAKQRTGCETCNEYVDTRAGPNHARMRVVYQLSYKGSINIPCKLGKMS